MPVRGQLYTPTLAVDPHDPTTDATYVLVDPDDGASAPITAVTADDGATFTGTPVRMSAAGQWRINWHVTGLGAIDVTHVVNVDPADSDAPVGFTFATTGDLVTYTGLPLPADARRLLIAASREVERLTRTAVYAVDTSGVPTDAAVAEALRDATCEIVSWGQLTGDPTGAIAAVSSASIGGVSLSFAKGAGGGVADRLGPALTTILTNANLLGQPVAVRG